MLSTIFTISTIAAVTSAASLGDNVVRRASGKTYSHSDITLTGKCEFVNGGIVDSRKVLTQTATSQQHYSSYCGGYSSPTLSRAPCPSYGDWESSKCFLDLFKECDSRSDCNGVNYKAYPGDGFSLRSGSPIANAPGSTFEWCNVITGYTETVEYECMNQRECNVGTDANCFPDINGHLPFTYYWGSCSSQCNHNF